MYPLDGIDPVDTRALLLLLNPRGRLKEQQFQDNLLTEFRISFLRGFFGRDGPLLSKYALFLSLSL